MESHSQSDGIYFLKNSMMAMITLFSTGEILIKTETERVWFLCFKPFWK